MGWQKQNLYSNTFIQKIVKDNFEKILNKLLLKAATVDYACILLSNDFPDAEGRYDWVAGFGAKSIVNDINQLDDTTFKFGFLSYDLKNRFENLHSNNKSINEIPDIFFFEPIEYIYKERNGNIGGNFEIENEQLGNLVVAVSETILFEPTITRNVYLENIAKIKNAIREGDYYELNYCTEWVAKNNIDFNPFAGFFALNSKSPAPFSAFFKFKNKFLMCSSPERFISAKGSRIVSQPIKGTRKRQANAHEDSVVKTELMTSEKDRAENVMITDLVRNDLSRFCKPGTVEVDELCGIHSFSHVHQMISTISGEIIDGVTLTEIIAASFPMGSMTGAPKIKVMEEIENLENFKRGWYSGSVGYIQPGCFDFNVVIRSLQYDLDNKKLAYHVGGAITYDSNAEAEYEECLTKAAGILGALGL